MTLFYYVFKSSPGGFTQCAQSSLNFHLKAFKIVCILARLRARPPERRGHSDADYNLPGYYANADNFRRGVSRGFVRITRVPFHLRTFFSQPFSLHPFASLRAFRYYGTTDDQTAPSRHTHFDLLISMHYAATASRECLILGVTLLYRVLALCLSSVIFLRNGKTRGGKNGR